MGKAAKHDLESLLDMLKRKGVTRFLLEFGAESEEEQGPAADAIGFRTTQGDEEDECEEGG